MSLCLLGGIRRYKHELSPSWLPKHELNKEYNKYVNVDEELHNHGMVRAGEMVFLKKEHIKWLRSIKWSALKTYRQVTSYKLSKIYVCIQE